jgi:hypothetical protein
MDLYAVGMRLARTSRQFGLRIEKIHLAWAAVLHKLNNRFGFGGKMSGTGDQIAEDWNGRRFPFQKIRKHDTAETEASLLEHLTPGKSVHVISLITTLLAYSVGVKATMQAF